MSWAVTRTRLPERMADPSTIASAFNSRAISGRLFLAHLYCMTEVPEMTRSEPTLARSVINWSVMPSTKNSSDGSPEKFLSGRTAMERIGGTAALEWLYRHVAQATNPSTDKAQRIKGIRLLFRFGCVVGG